MASTPLYPAGPQSPLVLPSGPQSKIFTPPVKASVKAPAKTIASNAADLLQASAEKIKSIFYPPKKQAMAFPVSESGKKVIAASGVKQQQDMQAAAENIGPVAPIGESVVRAVPRAAARILIKPIQGHQALNGQDVTAEYQPTHGSVAESILGSEPITPIFKPSKEVVAAKPKIAKALAGEAETTGGEHVADSAYQGALDKLGVKGQTPDFVKGLGGVIAGSLASSDIIPGIGGAKKGVAKSIEKTIVKDAAEHAGLIEQAAKYSTPEAFVESHVMRSEPSTLYHGTAPSTAVQILESGAIKPHAADGGKFVSMSRQKSGGSLSGSMVKFVLDDKKVGKTELYQDASVGHKEFEQRAANEIPLDAVKRIDVPINEDPGMVAQIKHFAAQRGIPVVAHEDLVAAHEAAHAGKEVAPAVEALPPAQALPNSTPSSDIPGNPAAAIPEPSHIPAAPEPNSAGVVPPPPIEPPIIPANAGAISPEPIPTPKPPLPEGMTEQVFKTGRFGLSAEEDTNLMNRLNVMGMDVRHIQTNKELRAASDQLGVNPADLLKDVKSNRITAQEVDALGNLIVDHSKFLTEARIQLKNDPRLELTLGPKITLAERQIDAALKKLVPGGTEAGRAVQAFNMLARQSMDPTFWMIQAQKQLGHRQLTGEMQSAIMDLINKSDRNGLAGLMASMKESTLAEKALTLWKAGLLTSPGTHEANIIGNTAMQVLQTASDLVAVPFDVMASLATGKRTALISPGAIASQVRSIPKAMRKGGEFFKTGVYPADMVGKWDIPSETNFKNPILDKYTKAVFRSLGGEDVVFREMTMQKSFVQQAQLIAKNEGLKGQEFKQRVGELLAQPTNDMARNAIDAAEYSTFQDKTALGAALGAMKSVGASKSQALGTVLDVLAPFTQTPSSIASKVLDYSSAGLVKFLVHSIKPETRTQEILIKDLSRAITGTGVMALGGLLYQKGLMTGDAPTDKAGKQQWQTEGKQANSILVNGHWLNLTRVSPVGNLLSMGANFENLSKDETGMALAASTAWSAIKGLTQMTALKGVSGGLQAINDPGRYGPSFVENTVASSVPSLSGKIAHVIDPRLRAPVGIPQAIESRIPGLDQNVPLKKDIFGQDIVAPGGRAGIIDPFNMTTQSNDPVLHELDHLGYGVGEPSQTLSGIKMDNAQYAKFQETNGKVLKKVLNSVVTSPDFQKLDNDKKTTMLDKVVNKIRSQVGDAYLPTLTIEHFNLPQDTDHHLLGEVARKLYSNDDFVKMSEEKKVKLIQKIMRQVAPTPTDQAQPASDVPVVSPVGQQSTQ